LCAPRPGAGADFAGLAEDRCVGAREGVRVSLGDAAGEDLPLWLAAGADVLV
jgi:hypothetical protein